MYTNNLKLQHKVVIQSLTSWKMQPHVGSIWSSLHLILILWGRCCWRLHTNQAAPREVQEASAWGALWSGRQEEWRKFLDATRSYVGKTWIYEKFSWLNRNVFPSFHYGGVYLISKNCKTCFLHNVLSIHTIV